VSLTVSVASIVEESADPRLRAPAEWSRKELGTVADVVNGAAFKSAQFSTSDGMPLIRIRDLGHETTTVRYAGAFDDQQRVVGGDLLVGMDGDFRVARWNGADALLNQRVCKIVPRASSSYGPYLELLLPAYLDAIHEHTSSQTVKHLSSKDIAAVPLPMPGLEDQRRFVARVEELMTHAEPVAGRLDLLATTVRRLRRSILSAAVSGRMTEDWRLAHPLDPVEDFVARRVRRRRQRASEDFVGGSEVTPVDSAGLPVVPEEWRWAYLRDVGYMSRGRSRHRPRGAAHLYGGPYPFIQTGEVSRSSGRITAHSKTYSEAGLEQSRLWPAGTVCITIAANIASTAVLTYPACFPDSVVGVVPDLCSSDYIELFLRTAKSDLDQFAPATSQKNINIAILNEVAVPIPPPSEQAEIVRRSRTAFDVLDLLDQRLDAARSHLGRFRQSVIAKLLSEDSSPLEP